MPPEIRQRRRASQAPQSKTLEEALQDAEPDTKEREVDGLGDANVVVFVGCALALGVAIFSFAESFFPTKSYVLATNGAVIGTSFAVPSAWAAPTQKHTVLRGGMYRIAALLTAFTVETFTIERNTFFALNIFGSILNCAHFVFFVMWAAIEAMRSASVAAEVAAQPRLRGGALAAVVAVSATAHDSDPDETVAKACARWRCCMGFDLETALKLALGVFGAAAVDVWGAPYLGPGGMPGMYQRNIASFMGAMVFCRFMPLMRFDSHHADYVVVTLIACAVIGTGLGWCISVESWPQVAYLSSLLAFIAVHFVFSLIHV